MLRSPYYLAVNLWNQLDEEMQTIQNRFDFKVIRILRRDWTC